MTLVQTALPSTYFRKSGKVGRPSNAEKVAKISTKIDEFFTPANGNLCGSHLELTGSNLQLGDETNSEAG